MTFTGISKEICEQAWNDVVAPTIRHMASVDLINKCDGFIVVVDPRASEDLSWDDRELFHASVNSVTTIKYAAIARDKAKLTASTGLSSSIIQTQAPHLYLDGDTKWGGSTIDDFGMIVAFSGVEAEFDEMIAEMMASAIRAICRNRMKSIMANQDISYIGEDD